MHKVHNVRTKKQKYKIYADSQNFVFWLHQNILNFDISPKSPFDKRGLCRYACTASERFIFTYPLNPLLEKGDFVATLRVGSIEVVGDSERRNSIRGGFAKFLYRVE